MRQPVVSVVTCDIVRSRKYSTEQRRKVDFVLKRSFNTLSRVYKEAIHTPLSFNVIMGDEFQFVVDKPEKSYEIVVFYRALVALADVTPMVSLRSSIGVGEIAVENRRDSYSQDGKAFHQSRQGIEQFQDPRWRGRRRTKIITGDASLNGTLEIVLMYQDFLEERWTRAQWEAVRWRFKLPTYEEIARKIGIAYQNVQKRLKAAKWDEFSQGLEFIERSLKAHL
ncbi:MAG: SatD family protein [Deltaproteobacteria bacterium]